MDISKETLNMLKSCTLIAKVTLNAKKQSPQVRLLTRSPKCMRTNEHEPRFWIVCLASLGGDGGWDYSYVTFHQNCGGSEGGLFRMGRLIEELTDGRL